GHCGSPLLCRVSRVVPIRPVPHAQVTEEMYSAEVCMRHYMIDDDNGRGTATSLDVAFRFEVRFILWRVHDFHWNPLMASKPLRISSALRTGPAAFRDEAVFPCAMAFRRSSRKALIASFHSFWVMV